MTGRIIRVLTRAELDTLVEWAALEGWNPGLHDAEAFHAADPEGFLGAFVDGGLAAGISAVRYGSDFGFIGLYICRADLRDEGHGKAVWDAGMERLSGCTVGLDAVPAQKANYGRMGFVPAYRTFRYSGRFEAAGSDADIRPIEPDDFPRIAAFDRTCFPAPRPSFLRQWTGDGHFALSSVRDGAIRGYAVRRPCREGFKIGPLFAEDLETATGLLSALARGCDGDLQLDVPDANPAFAETLLNAGMSRGFETTRMYRGPAPDMAMSRIFAVTTLELG
ncbi:GNAT family N-acetyltransferase [Aquibium sp. LZ166]|uniref:GNAT family N-acetyltransferase n=1 Tax=Aquibium pacificus TaxID=3153579 RepID=A0ABV3SE50_9HYPH